jgi:hypothetical protein
MSHSEPKHVDYDFKNNKAVTTVVLHGNNK